MTASDPILDSLEGTVVAGRYQIVRKIGEGGMGTVYEAVHVELNKTVAIKSILRKYSEDSLLVERFRREALAASAVGNEHIIDITDTGKMEDGRPFFVMEFLTGEPLSAIMEREPRLSVGRAVGIALQIGHALEAAHRAGVIHRDLKLDNVMILSNRAQPDFVKVLDFGVSKLLRPSPQESQARAELTTTGLALGTPNYMSPEQAEAVGAVDHRSDIYAAGVVLYRLVTGRLPFSAASVPMLIVKITTADALTPHEIDPGIPKDFSQVLMRALAKQPSDRYSSMAEFCDALRRFREIDNELGALVCARATADSETVAVTPPESKPPRMLLTANRARRWLFASPQFWLVVIALCAIASSVFYVRTHGSDDTPTPRIGSPPEVELVPAPETAEDPAPEVNETLVPVLANPGRAANGVSLLGTAQRHRPDGFRGTLDSGASRVPDDSAPTSQAARF